MLNIREELPSNDLLGFFFPEPSSSSSKSAAAASGLSSDDDLDEDMEEEDENDDDEDDEEIPLDIEEEAASKKARQEGEIHTEHIQVSKTIKISVYSESDAYPSNSLGVFKLIFNVNVFPF